MYELQVRQSFSETCWSYLIRGVRMSKQSCPLILRIREFCACYKNVLSRSSNLFLCSYQLLYSNGYSILWKLTHHSKSI